MILRDTQSILEFLHSQRCFTNSFLSFAFPLFSQRYVSPEKETTAEVAVVPVAQKKPVRKQPSLEGGLEVIVDVTARRVRIR